MKRREFITLLGGAIAWTRPAHAQHGKQMRQIGMLLPGSEANPMADGFAVFLKRLRDLGWVEGRNLEIERRWAEGDTDRMRVYANELVGRRPDLIVAGNTPITAALLRETRAIPIVFVSVADPESRGFVESLARPGGNVTGFASLEPSLGGKWLELLSEIAPGLRRVGLIFNPETAPGRGLFFLRPIEAAAVAFKMETIATPVRNPADIETALATLAREPRSGLIVPPDNFTQVHRETITSLAVRHRLPAVYAYRFMVVLGGLVSYGVDNVDLFRRTAEYVDRVLRGEKPSDLPVQAPTKFELVINLKTAKVLRLTIPQSILLRADEVIE